MVGRLSGGQLKMKDVVLSAMGADELNFLHVRTGL